MFSIVLYQPEIPPNTGAVMRLAANTGCRLHLIEPLGFQMSHTRLRRAGMDYRDKAVTEVHASLRAWQEECRPRRVIAFSPHSQLWHSELEYLPGDALLFGPESVGLPAAVLSAPWVDDTVRIPMLPDVRSLNLANSVSVAVYEAWRQHGHRGAT
ncbi:MAG: tRNA (cytidine(34)-2'-O)-methyltransferase [bacterium]|nr:tRNA (cytidine(34)-2'-O)-methyltransferase [Acidimicrobiia bacterium]MCY4649266.1 tRNA (cytidine(34)-2'-O)-methyltransferase [bacterium]